MSPRKKKSKIANDVSTNTIDFFFKNPNRPDPSQNPASDITTSQSEHAIESTDDDESIARKLQEQFDEELRGSQVEDGRDVVSDSHATTVESTSVLETVESQLVAVENAQEDDNVADKDVNSNTAPLDKSAIYTYIDAIDFSLEPTTFPIDLHTEHITVTPKHAPYALLARLFVQLTSTRSRIKILNILTNYLRLLLFIDKDSLLPSVWLCTNTLGPHYASPDLGLGWSVVSKSLKNVSGVSTSGLKSLYDKHGDLGDVAFEAKVSVRTLGSPPRLTIDGVYKTLLQICEAKGMKSQEVKRKLVERLLISARGEEVRYLTRTFIQNVCSWGGFFC